jgi:hypothetical protein
MKNRLYIVYERQKSDLLKNIFKVANEKGYTIFYSNSVYPINLNIWGIRNGDKDTKKYDDLLVLFNEEANIENAVYLIDNKFWNIQIYECTTTPSDNYLLKPLNNKGTAILKAGQHKGLWKLGYHKGNYKALVQANPVTVIRDNNKDDKLDFNNKTETGMFGINCHHAGNIISDFIGLYSAGCQVLKDTKLFNSEFIPYVKRGLNEGHTVSYTLINEFDLHVANINYEYERKNQ